MFNLSNVLDDMELTGAPPYHNKGHYYNVSDRSFCQRNRPPRRLRVFAGL